jgi:hypothetical protein
MDRLEELSQKFPDVPRSIIIKTDVLREGIQFNDAILEIGRWALPDYLPWDPDVLVQYKAIAGDLIDECWAWMPMTFHFKDDGVCTKILGDFLRRTVSPYEIRAHDQDRFFLHRDGYPIAEIGFERRPDWIGQRSSNGELFGSALYAATPHGLVGFPIKFCAYYKSEDVCRFCCLNPADVNLPQKLKKSTMLYAQRYAEAYDAALNEGEVHHICLSGGTLKDSKKEADRYVEVISELDRVRRSRNAKTVISPMCSAFPAEDLERMRRAGTDEVSINMEVWEESLWPEILPGKSRQVGRKNWMERLLAAQQVFGRRRARSRFVVGVEIVSPKGFSSLDEGIRSVLDGFEWCCRNGIQPDIAIWMNTPGSVYEERQCPPTEYFLTVMSERHKVMTSYDMYPRDGEGGPFNHCPACTYLSADIDFHWLEMGALQRTEAIA